MDEVRYSRLEARVDQIKDDVAELKADSKLKTQLLIDLKQEFKECTEEIKEHVIGDNKVISKLEPLLESFQDIHILVNDHKFKKEQVIRRHELIKKWSIALGLLGTTVGVVVGIVELSKFF
jgi:hypothetical protein